MAAHTNNYTLGRGMIFFDKFTTGTKTRTGERYLGNTPSLSMTTANQMLEHYSSDHGLKQKDASVQLQTDRTGKFQCDDMSPENVSLLFGTDPTTRATLAATAVAETFVVRKGLYYQFGRTEGAIVEGIRNVTSVTVSDNTGLKAAGTLNFTGIPTALDTVTINAVPITFVSGAPGAGESQIGGTAAITAQALKGVINANQATYGVVATGTGILLTLTALNGGTAGNSITLAKSGTYPAVSGANLTGGTAGGTVPSAANWEVDLTKGRLHILPDASSIADGDSLVVHYNVSVNSQTIIIDDGKEVEGALRFISDNPEGEQRDYYWPDVKVTANGDYALKGDTWLTIDFNFEALTLDDNTKRVYISN